MNHLYELATGQAGFQVIFGNQPIGINIAIGISWHHLFAMIPIASCLNVQIANIRIQLT